MLLKNIMVKL
uniref:Uncharacterized protein n=1 Tax=Rhizophora mucronata TaxID=61149 RepID=A0A2P2PHY3_RHIMU